MQLRLSEEEFIMVKKATLNAKLTLENFLKAAVFEKLLSDIAKNKAGKNKNKSYPQTGGSKK
jgi:hypothetical protein